MLSRVPHPLLFPIPTSPKVELNMQNRTDTLEIGSPAPDFSLGAANREGTFTLQERIGTVGVGLCPVQAGRSRS